jgi:hypothetical protein
MSKTRKSVKRQRKVPVLRSRRHRDAFSLIAAALSVCFVVLFSFWLGKELYDLRSRGAGTGWVDSDRSVLKATAWFTQHGYSDCPTEAGGFWPTSRADCLISEPGGGPTVQDQFIEPVSGPSVQDQSIAPEPQGLYYKHLLPTDFIRTIPSLVLNIDFSGLNKATLENTLLQAIQQNPATYATISVDSLDVGLEGGNTGTMVRTLSLYIHPQFERPISGAIGVLQRAQNLYKPFIEGATGSTISDADLTELYTAGLNKCGAHSLNNDQSGLGVFKTVGGNIVSVQNWNMADTTSIIGGDCNIHVVKIASPSVSPPPPGVITPTFGCLGPCVPTAQPSVQPTATPPVFTPTNTPGPDVTETPVLSPPVATPTPGGSKGGNSFLQLLLALIQIILAFFASLFGGTHA